MANIRSKDFLSDMERKINSIRQFASDRVLGGIHTLAGPVVGAVSFTWLQDAVARNTDYWRAMLGAIMLVIVLVFPDGIAGGVQKLVRRLRPVPARAGAT